MIITTIVYFGQPCVVGCDARCNKAWGINSRPHIDYDDWDDRAWLADDELGDAPVDPGTYEGGDAKPRTPGERLNKWCVRECERSVVATQGAVLDLPDFSRRVYNQPEKHQGAVDETGQ